MMSFADDTVVLCLDKNRQALKTVGEIGFAKHSQIVCLKNRFGPTAGIR